MLHEELTRKILGACFEVTEELGHGFLESVYERALVAGTLPERAFGRETGSAVRSFPRGVGRGVPGRHGR